MTMQNDKFDFDAYMELRPDVLEKVGSIIDDENIPSVEIAFKKYLEDTFQSFLFCPSCANNLNENVCLRGLPIVEAEKENLVKPLNEFSRRWAEEHNMYFGICPVCLRWYTPDKTTFELCKVQ